MVVAAVLAAGCTRSSSADAAAVDFTATADTRPGAGQGTGLRSFPDTLAGTDTGALRSGPDTTVQGIVPAAGDPSDPIPPLYVRETYAFPAMTAEPFLSLVVEDIELRPRIDEIRIVAIVADRDPQRSVVLLQEGRSTAQAGSELIRLGVGQTLGNFRIVAIRVDGMTVETKVHGRPQTQFVAFDPAGTP